MRLGATPTAGVLAATLLAGTVLAGTVLAACGGDDRADAGGGSGGGEPTTVTVTIADFMFGPEAVTVPAGSTVVFTNADGQAHTATARGGEFDTDSIAATATAEITVGETGSIPYYCAFHPFMEGTVVVA